MDDRRWISLLNGRYKSLMSNDRTYAAFVKDDIIPLMEQLYCNGHREIFDPMSGYGSLIQYCYQFNGMGTYGIELNTPSYLWQLLNLPGNVKIVKETINIIQKEESCFKKAKVRCEASNDWFTDTGKEIALDIYQKIKKAFSFFIYERTFLVQMSLALYLPFIGRLACFVKPNSNEPHLKKGNTCVYFEYEKAFLNYMKLIYKRCENTLSIYNDNSHTVVLGDCSQVKLDQNRFTCMITSPPYPNSIDYNKLFGPENYILRWLQEMGEVEFELPKGYTIGTNIVSKRETNDVKSEAARNFLAKLSAYKIDELNKEEKHANRNNKKMPKLKKIVNDNQCYYVPYFKNYFADLENAYEKIASSLNDEFEGYIIVSDNTARDFIVPASDCIKDTWVRLGFKVDMSSKKEKTHIGTKNPAAKGLKAKHTEYIIKVSR